MNLPNYLEEHAKVVPHMMTARLLQLAAQELRKKEHVVSANFYIKALPNGDFEVVYEGNDDE